MRMKKMMIWKEKEIGRIERINEKKD